MLGAEASGLIPSSVPLDTPKQSMVDGDENAYLGPHSRGCLNVFHIDGIHMRLQLKHVKLLLKHQVAQKHPKTTSFGPGKQIIGTRNTH